MTSGLSPRKYPHSNSSSILLQGSAQHRYRFSVPSLPASSERSTPKSNLTTNSLCRQIENMLREIDPCFVLSDQNQSNQIIQCIQQATEFIINTKSKLLADPDLTILTKAQTACEHCGKPSEIISCQQKQLLSQAENLKRKLKSFEKFKFIQSEKIKEEKEVMKQMKGRLEVITESLVRQKTEVNGERVLTGMKLVVETGKNLSPVKNRNVGKEENCVELQVFKGFKLENAIDFSSLVEEIENQLKIFNNEIMCKERVLSEREAQVRIAESDVERRLSEIEMMKISLKSSKVDLLVLQQETLPEIEVQSELIALLINDLIAKKAQVEELIESISKKGLPLPSSSIAISEAENFRAEAEKKYKENCKFSDYLKQMQKEFDKYYSEKNKELKDTSEKLAKLQKSVNFSMEAINRKEKDLLAISQMLSEKEKLVNLKLGTPRYSEFMEPCDNDEKISKQRLIRLRSNRKSVYTEVTQNLND